MVVSAKPRGIRFRKRAPTLFAGPLGGMTAMRTRPPRNVCSRSYCGLPPAGDLPIQHSRNPRYSTMSDTETANTSTLQAVPDPEPLNGPTGAPAAVYTELLATPGATVAQLALAAGVGRSTAGKALVTLEEQGLAVRHAGEHTDGRRTADRWHPARRATATEEAEAADPATTDPASGSPEHSTPDSCAAADDPSLGDPTDDPQDDSPEGGATQDTEGPDTAEAEGTADTEPSESGQQSGAEIAPVVAPRTNRVRLAPGGLRQMVIDHLQAHPGEAFTATRISRVIEKSSGAIANALATLTQQGIAEQVSDKPRTYRVAAAESATE